MERRREHHEGDEAIKSVAEDMIKIFGSVDTVGAVGAVGVVVIGILKILKCLT